MATIQTAENGQQAAHGKDIMPLVVGAIGVVFGDIGTSPLYTIRECLKGGTHELPITPDNIYGILSLIFWSLAAVFRSARRGTA